MYACSGILTALYERQRTGAGCTLDVAMIDALSEWMMQPTYLSVYGGRPACRTGARHASIAPYGPYRAGDGSTVCLAVQNDREWATLCRDVLARPELVDDDLFHRNTERVEHDDDITAVVETSFGTMTADRAVELLDAAGIACARMRTPAEFYDHPRLATRDRWRDVDSPGGLIKALVPPGRRPRPSTPDARRAGAGPGRRTHPHRVPPAPVATNRPADG